MILWHWWEKIKTGTSIVCQLLFYLWTNETSTLLSSLRDTIRTAYLSWNRVSKYLWDWENHFTNSCSFEFIWRLHKILWNFTESRQESMEKISLIFLMIKIIHIFFIDNWQRLAQTETKNHIFLYDFEYYLSL